MFHAAFGPGYLLVDTIISQSDHNIFSFYFCIRSILTVVGKRLTTPSAMRTTV